MHTFVELEEELQALWRHVQEDQGVYLITIARCQLWTNDQTVISACARCRGRELRADPRLLRLFVSKEGPACPVGEGDKGSVRATKGQGLADGVARSAAANGNGANLGKRESKGARTEHAAMQRFGGTRKSDN